jgi:hypothetical protein
LREGGAGGIGDLCRKILPAAKALLHRAKFTIS